MGHWDNIEKEESFARNYIKPGNYLVQVKKCVGRLSFKGKKPTFIAELDIIEAAPGSEHKPGDCPSLVEVDERDEDTGKSVNGGAGRVKAFLQACFPTLKIDGAGVDAVTGPKNPAKGKLVRLRATAGKSAKGGDIVQKVWDAAEELTPEQIREKRIAAGLSPDL